MMYGAYQDFWSSEYRWTEIPQGKVRSVSVLGDMGIAITARTENTEAAFTALKGIVNTMQRFVPVPAQKEARRKTWRLPQDTASGRDRSY